MPEEHALFIKLPDLARSLGCHEAMVRMMWRFGLMPDPYKCEDGEIRWKCSEIAAWVAHHFPTIDEDQLREARQELEFLTRDDLAELLGVHAHTIDRMAQSGRLPKPVLRTRRMTRWSLEQIGEWVKDGCPVVDPQAVEKN